MPPTDNLQDRRNKLQHAYVQSLPAKADELRQCWQACRRFNWPPHAVQQLFLLVHRLTGSGTAFGFPQLSTAAGCAEQLLGVCRDNAEPAKDQLFAVEHALDNLCRLLVDLGQQAPAVSGVPLTLTTRAPVAQPGGGPRQLPLIYLAEDDEIQAEALAQKLVAYGYMVRTFGDLGTLEQAIQARRPDAVLMDIVFPGDDSAGLAAAHYLERQGSVTIPTLFVSQRGDIHARLDASRSGAVGYLTKPINPLQLINRLEELLSTQPPEPPRVLIVDDDEDLTRWYQAAFSEAGMDTAILSDPMGVMAPLVEFRPELLLLDLHMPGASGLDITLALRQEEAYTRLPIMIVSHDSDPERQLRCLDAGADDYLVKPVDGDFLTRLVRLRIQRQRRLQQAISRDPLTGLLNRGAFLEHFETLLGITMRTQGKLTVAMLDLDGFQQINDRHGHLGGDIVLKTMARQLAAAVRRTDILGRFGGDEFVLVLPDTETDAAYRLLQQIHQRLTAMEHQQLHGEEQHRLSLSVGMASCNYRDRQLLPLDTDQLLASADQALWFAKCAGGNRLWMAEKPSSATPEGGRQ